MHSCCLSGSGWVYWFSAGWCVFKTIWEGIMKQSKMRILCLLLTAVMLLSLTACSKDK